MTEKIIYVSTLTLTYVLQNLHNCYATTDINTAELQYLADHLSLEECRKLVAASHFKSYELPNALSEAELRITNDLSCFDLLLHWNSSPGEGKGQSHEILEHRLRQLGKYQLADWLGKTVFHQIGEELEKALEDGLAGTENESATLEPLVELPTAKYEDPTEWTSMDSIMFAVLSILLLASASACLIVLYSYTCKRLRRKKTLPKYRRIEFSENSSSESEDKFDVRNAKTSIFSEPSTEHTRGGSIFERM